MFQFLMVRLKAAVLNEVNDVFMFQFLMVRLKECGRAENLPVIGSFNSLWFD